MILNFGFEISDFFRHSSFVLRHLCFPYPLTTFLPATACGNNPEKTHSEKPRFPREKRPPIYDIREKGMKTP
jgi:hypothetical protein